MLRFFRTIQPLGLFFAVVYAALLMAHLWLHPAAWVPPDSENLSSLMWQGLFNLSAWPARLYTSFMFLCTALLAMYVVRVAALSRYTPQWSLMPVPALLSLLFLMEKGALHPEGILAAFFLLRLFVLSVRSYNKVQADALWIDSGFYIGLLSLLHPFFLLLLPVLLLAYAGIRTISFREAVVLLSGIVVVYVVVSLVLLWNRELELLWLPFQDVGFGMVLPAGLNDWLALVTAGLVLALAVGFVRMKLSVQLIQFRRLTGVLFWLMLCALLVSTLHPEGPFALSWSWCALGALPLCWWWMQLRNRDMADMIHLAVLGTVIVFQYINFAL